MVKTVMITGASRGVGEATARLFAKNGWQVAATARDPKALGSWVQTSNVAAIRLDVTDSESIRQAIEQTERHFGSIDVLVNNAGAGLGGAVEEVTREALIKLFDLNLFGLIGTTQAVLPSMRRRASGVIVNVSSAAGRIGLPFLAPYCASKFAVEGLSEAMSYELAQFGIKVKLVEPGGIKTSFAHVWAESSAYDPAVGLVREHYSAGAQQASGPESVAEAIFRAATDGKPRLRYTVNGAASFLILNRVLPEWAWRAVLGKAFSKSIRKQPA